MSHSQPPGEERSGLPARLPEGYRIAGRYVVRRFLALGATTRVYAAEDLCTGASVAVKVVRYDTGMPNTTIDRFQHEVLVSRLFDSPHLPRVHDQGRLADGSLFMVMELLLGPTLDQRLGDALPAVAAVVELGVQLMAALTAAHAQGNVHSDVKPHNVILQPDPERGTLVKLIDFGIATRDLGRPDHSAPRETVVGTPPYMSPEQARGLRLDVRTDVYSAGVVLYQSLTGRLPFDGASSQEIMQAILRVPVVPPRVLRPECPEALERVLLRAMCRDREYRYASARAVQQELFAIAERERLPRGARAWAEQSAARARPAITPYDPTRPALRVDPGRRAELPMSPLGEDSPKLPATGQHPPARRTSALNGGAPADRSADRTPKR